VNYLVAVSGGIDSVVLLDRLVAEGNHELVVAHFDHGIRPDSADDARFVAELAARHGLPFVTRRENLGREASEETARTRRYEFLRAEAKKRGLQIVTAHHSDDVVETMAINLIRGTGWRGMAVMDGRGVVRPLLSFTKQQIRQYALERRLEWVEDSTNSSDDYLRNRVRRRIARELSAERRESVLAVWDRQVKLKREIDAEVQGLLGQMGDEYDRYFFIQISPLAATELLRALVLAAAGATPTRPQLERGVLAVKTARPNTRFRLGDAWLQFGTGTFTVSVKTP
jgi:tRNA(Ile)-lysidine synthase